MTTKTLYKVMKKDLTSVYYPDEPYTLGKEYVCGDFDSSNEECSRGFYAVDLEGLPYAWANDGKKVITEVKVSGKSKEFSQYKRRFEKQTITRVLGKEEVLALIKEQNRDIGYNLSEVLYPINPLLIENILESKHKLLLKEWASVRDSVWNSLEDSLVGYISSMFYNIEKWKYIDIDCKPFENPFQSCVDLWKDGFVPTFDGGVWRLHQGKDAKVVFEVTKEDLQKLK